MTTMYYQDRAGEWRWRMVSRNGEIIGASSEGFASLDIARRNYDLIAARRASAVGICAVVFALLLGVALALMLAGCASLRPVIDAALDEWVPRPPAVVTNVPPTPAPTPAPSSAGGDGVAFGGPLAGLPISATVTLTRVTSGRIWWSEEGGRAAWPRKSVKVEVNAVAHLGVVREGRVVALGKFDWVRPGQKMKGLENVHNGYGTFANPDNRPRAGDQIFVMLVSVDGRTRSNASVPVAYK